MTTIQDDWKAMILVRFIGGPHIHQHIDTPTVLAKVKPVLTEDHVYNDVCNAEGTQEMLESWLTKTTCTILEAATLHGT
jgi:hypothetical protein